MHAKRPINLGHKNIKILSIETFMNQICVSEFGRKVINCAHTSLTHSLTSYSSTALLEKLTVSQLVKKFPPFYGTRRFITAFTSARHLSLY